MCYGGRKGVEQAYEVVYLLVSQTSSWLQGFLCCEIWPFSLSRFVVCFHCMPVPPCSVPNNVCPLWKPTGPWQEGSWWPVVSLSGSLASQCLLLPPYRRGSPCSDWFQMKWVLAWVCWFPSLPGLASGGAGTAKPYVWQFRSRCGVHVCQI